MSHSDSNAHGKIQSAAFSRSYRGGFANRKLAGRQVRQLPSLGQSAMRRRLPVWQACAPAVESGARRTPAQLPGRNCGKSITSRMLSAPVSRMQRRSMPTPMPPAGGMPCSSASRKSWSMFCFSSPAWRLEHLALHERIVLLRVGRRDLHPADGKLEHVERRRILAVDLGQRAELLRQVEHEGRLDEGRLDPLGEDLVGDLEFLPVRLDLQAELLRRGDLLRLAPAEPFRIARSRR